jgi:DNA primase
VGIVDEDVARVREATDVVGVVGEQVALKRVGTRLQGLCPFHSERSPSFSLNPSLGVYHCFGCQASGDVITFVRETQHLDFAGAVEWLANRAGIELHYDSPAATREHQRRGALVAAMAKAVDWYHARLLEAPDAGPARKYLRHERGYDRETVEAFKLGWAPEGWDELCRALRADPQVLADAGLAFRSKAGKQIDAFRGRVMFPIFDVDGKPVAFGGRVLPGGAGPKYKNSQEGPLYSKRRVLYGLNWSKDDIVRAGEVIVCEGYTDVIAFHRAGMPRAVATCGTALADEHMAKLKNFARRIILAYDADAAGQGAAERFYAWEQRLELDIFVLALPAGSDPGSTAPDTLREAVASARPFLEFRVNRILEAADLSTLEGQVRAADKALAAIAAHPNDLVRDQYLMTVADRCRIKDADRLRQRLEELRRARHEGAGRRPGGAGRRPGRANGGTRRPGDDERLPERRTDESPDAWGDDGRYAPPDEVEWRDAPPAVPPLSRPPGGAELEALRFAVHRPESVAHLLEPILFDDAVGRAALQCLLDAPTLTEAIERADPSAQSLLYVLAVEEPAEETDPDDVLAILVRSAAQRAIAGIEAEARASQSVIDLRWPKERIEALGDAGSRVEAASQLVAWISGAGQEGA